MASKAVAGVYAIRHTASGSVYVGSSINIANRWVSHRPTFQGDEYEWVVLEETDPTPDALELAEQRWMDYYSERLCNRQQVARRGRPNRLYLKLRGLRLQERREALGLSTSRLAREFGCTASSIHRWETGREEIHPLKAIGADTVLKRLESEQRRDRRGGDR